MEIISHVEDEARRIFRSAKGRVKHLTATEALDHQGSCTSCGNLVAALLRSSDVPARVLAGYPSWSGPLQTHYIVEAWVPGFGWYPIESTMLRSPWANCHQVNVSIVPIEYESEKLAGRRTSVAGGVPYLSLTEQTGRPMIKVGNIPGAKHCDHVSLLSSELKAGPEQWEELIAQSNSRWAKWLDQQAGIDTAEKRTFGKQGHLPKYESLEQLTADLDGE